jgi:hypothetical protein
LQTAYKKSVRRGEEMDDETDKKFKAYTGKQE